MEGVPVTAAYALRPATGADEPFLRVLLAATMSRELAGLTTAQAGSRVTTRRLKLAWGWRSRHPLAESSIVLDGDGRPAGHLVLEQTDEAVHLLWLALLPGHRGRGLGSAVLLGVQDRAAEAGLPAVAHGAPRDAAAALLVSHGFWVDPEVGARPVWRPALA